jgi:3-oxoacyl-[acyl-carrier-protein] synthase II
MKNRAVITGLGVVSPIGIGKAPFWKSLVNGESGVGPITLFDASGLKSRVAAEVKGFNPLDFMEASMKPKRMSRHTQFAIAATKLALEDAQLDLKRSVRDTELPIIMGISTSDFSIIADSGAMVSAKGPGMASPFVITATNPHAVSSTIANYLHCPAHCVTVSNTCASGMDAVAMAADLIRKGTHDLVLAGGTDAPIAMVPFANFDNAGMASRCNDQPETAGRPFSKDRDTGVIGEGAGVLVIENLESALARGANIYGEVTGYGIFTDNDPSVSGCGWKQSMQQALDNSGRMPQEIEYICAWGPGHPSIDKVETQMIKEVFGKHSYSVPITSIKGAIGNPLAGAAPLMLAGCLLALSEGILPPTAHCYVPDPECDLDYIPKGFRRKDINIALLNAHGLGGGNSSMIVEKVLLS